jgi:hypothetical protein
MSKQVVTLHVYRLIGGKSSHYDEFEIPYSRDLPCWMD